MARKRIKLSDRVRRAARESGKSLNQLSRETGIDKAALSRFINGKVGLELANLDRLADVLDLDVTSKTLRGKSRAKKLKGRPSKGR